MAKQEEAQSNPVLLQTSDKRLGPPYFVDINNDVCGNFECSLLFIVNTDGTLTHATVFSCV